MGAMFRSLTFGSALVIWLAGCTSGRDFVRPESTDFTLGKTTYQEVVSKLGKPYGENTSTYNGKRFQHISYIYMSETDIPHVPDTVATRSMGLSFYNGTLVSEAFASSFKNDNTDFDESKISKIVKGKTKCDEVLQLFGRPNGKAIYPAIEKEGEHALLYYYSQLKRPILSFKTFDKQLLISCGANDLVTDVVFATSGER